MDPSEHSANSARNFFDAASILNSAVFGPASVTSGLTFPHLAHIPSAFSMLGHPPGFPLPPFGGLGALNDGLGNPLRHSLNPAAASLLHTFGSSPMFNLGSGKSSVAKSSSSSTTSTSSSGRSSSVNRGGHPSVTSSSAQSKSKHRTKPSHSQSPTVMTSSINWDPAGILSAQVSRVSSSSSSSSTTTITNSTNTSSPSLSFMQGRKTATSNIITPTTSANNNTKATNVLHPTQAGQRNNFETEKNVSPRTSPTLKKSSATLNPEHQIDGTKKRLIADQIRQKMRTIMTPLQTPIYKPEKYRPRGKGRPVKSPQALPTHIGMESFDSESVGGLNADDQPLPLVKKPAHQSSRVESPPTTYTPLNLKTTPTPLPSEVQTKKFENGDEKDGRISSNGQQNETATAAASSNSSSSESDSESGSESDSSDGTDSESETNSLESDDDELLTRDSETSVTSLSTGDKRSADTSGTGSDTPTPVKKKRRVIDEKELRIPLEHSWQRQTKIRGIGKRGIVGDVLYHAPCGKKLRTYPDVMKYLEKNGITDLCKENFSFSTKAPIGEFLEMRPGENNYVLLSEHEVFDRYTQVQFNRSRRRRHLDPEAAALRKKKKEEKEEAVRQAAELKMQRKMERQKEKEMVQNEKKIRAIERQQQKEQEKQLKQHEKIKRQEQFRMERELRAQQVLESNLFWYHMEREREMKRQQAVMMREQQERERRRQHMLLVKSLEARRRQEERERMKEEKLKEKQIEKERRMNQRRVELQIAAELKKPIEDMEIKDIKEMPDLPRIDGLCLAGKAFADALMVVEFMHNFGKALGISEDATPSLNELQSYLMGDTREDSDKYINFTSKLLKIALSDPGVPNPKEAVTKLGQKITDIELNKNVISEVLRIFSIARNGGSCQISDWLAEKPLKALNPTQKSSVLEFLCNELLCGRLLTNEIEKTIEGMSNLRRDKWIAEGKLRRLRIVQTKKYNRPSPKISLQGGSSPLLDEDSHATNVSGSKQGSDDDDDSGNDSDVTTVTSVGVISEGEEDDPSTAEECEKKIERLQRQHSQYRDKVFESANKLRAVSFGQDRYKRRYWLLPYCGRLVLEGLESGALGSEDEEEDTDDDDEEEEEENGNEADDDDDEDDEGGEEEEEETKCPTENEDTKDSIKKEVKSEAEDEEAETEDAVVSSTPVKQEPSKEKTEKTEPLKCSSPNNSPILKQESPTNLFLQKPETTKFSDLMHIQKSEGSSSPNPKNSPVNNSHSLTSQTPSLSSSVNTSPSVKNSSISANSESKSSFISIDSILRKDYEPSSEAFPFLPSMATYPAIPPLFTDQLLKATEINEQKPWFSILPRMPCDETSLTRSPLNISHRMLNNSPFLFHPPLPFHAFPVRSPTFASFQMGQIQGNPVDMNLGPLADNTNNSNSFFKVPSVPQEICSSRSSTPSASLNNTPIMNSAGLTSLTPNGSASMDLMMDPDPEGLLKSLQGELKPIPKAMRTGWWHLADIEHLKGVLKCLHPRGIRERNLQKSLQKHFDLVCQACTKDVKDEFKLKERDEFRFVSTTGAPPTDNDSNVMSAVAHQVENEVLEEIMKLEERVYSASLQVKIRSQDRDRHDEQASTKGSRLAQKASSESAGKPKEKPVEEKPDENQSLLENARERLIKLEKNIERRYLKPPLCKSLNLAHITLPGDNHSSSCHDSKDEEEDVPPGLLTWRNAVHSSSSAAQLTLCANLLANSIAWEKSIMKVLCQICRKDDNEAELLLCDGCDKGYHTYCFKPKMDKIPEGDWYCYECISKATGVPCCVVCGKKNGKLALCDECPRAFHIECMIPPLQRLPKKWLCASCVAEKGNKKSKRGRKKKEEPLKKEKKTCENNKSDEERKKEQHAKDMSLCKVILLELEKNENGWPFLQPVNQKQFPSYKKYIKKPMDFYTMRLKLRDNQYKSKEQFSADAHLIFDNCELFNEDDSEVGKAGHNLRSYFVKRWTEQLNQSRKADDTPPTAVLPPPPPSSSSSSLSSSMKGGGGDNDSNEES